MNIKTAFRYQNFLSDLQGKAFSAFREVRNTQTEEHQKSLADTEAADETVTIANPKIEAGITAEKCLTLIFDIFEEKAAIDLAVAKAKKIHGDFDLDAELNINKARRNLIGSLEFYTGERSTETLTNGRAYKFNVEGNQISYTYPVKQLTELNFDPEALSERLKELSAKADEVSDRADAFLLENTIDFTPKFDIHDKFERIVQSYPD